MPCRLQLQTRLALIDPSMKPRGASAPHRLLRLGLAVAWWLPAAVCLGTGLPGAIRDSLPLFAAGAAASLLAAVLSSRTLGMMATGTCALLVGLGWMVLGDSRFPPQAGAILAILGLLTRLSGTRDLEVALQQRAATRVLAALFAWVAPIVAAPFLFPSLLPYGVTTALLAALAPAVLIAEVLVRRRLAGNAGG